MTTTELDADVYVTTVYIDEIFADDTYQRPVDTARAKKMAAAWDRRLAGILEVSDRGEQHSPRYAVVDGQHRWAAAGYVNDGRALVANVHTGLTVADEAKLFDRLNRERRRPSTWDHWRARTAAGDKTVQEISTVVEYAGLQISTAPKDGNVRCTSTLEKLHKLGGTNLIRDTLNVILDVWGRRLDAYDAPIVHGVGLVLHFLKEPLDMARLEEALLDVVPRQLKSQALALRDMTTGAQPVLVAIAIMSIYNRRPGRKILVSNRTFGGGAVNAHSTRTENAVAS